MARIPQNDIERLKNEVSVERLVESAGIALKKSGKDYIGLCPFHDDSEPSLVVTPAKNLWHCFGCGAAGGPIDWVMKIKGVSFRHAVELLRTDPALAAEGLNTLDAPVKRSHVRSLPPPVAFDADDQALLNQTIDYYHETLKQSPEAVAYRHGLRVSELCALRWTHIDFAASRIDLVRAKRSTSLPHPLSGDEMRLLRQMQRQQQDQMACAYVFMTERLGPMSPSGFSQMLARTGKAAGFGFRVHPHMLRHACGYKLANDGCDIRTIQDYLGHKNIQHTVRYTQLAADRFKGLWDE